VPAHAGPSFEVIVISSANNYDKFSQICMSCGLGGGCCKDAHPPLTQHRIEALLRHGASPDDIEHIGYHRLKTKEDGFCVLFENGRCRVHEAKPETCIAGPFTFDISGDFLEIYLKKESICPMAGSLIEDEEAYREQYNRAMEEIIRLVRDLSQEELSVILKIEEPETVKVGEVRLKERHDRRN